MKPILTIGAKEYKFKKDALAHYRMILNSYKFNESLNDEDFKDLLDLLEYNDNRENSDKEEIHSSNLASLIKTIKVSKAQFNKKCFEVFYNDDSSCFISYIMIINNTKLSPADLFYKACRNTIHGDIRSVKQEYFDKHSVKGMVKCQETQILSKWEELVVDHRQPNTFSMIVERFKEYYKVNLNRVNYIINDDNLLVFRNPKATHRFRMFHKDKATLRIVRKECNLARASMARIKKTKADLTVKIDSNNK